MLEHTFIHVPGIGAKTERRLWQRGILWAGGPSSYPSAGIEIYSVDSIEEAIKAQRSAPLYVKGVIFDDTYYEWHPKLLPS